MVVFVTEATHLFFLPLFSSPTTKKKTTHSTTTYSSILFRLSFVVWDLGYSKFQKKIFIIRKIIAVFLKKGQCLTLKQDRLPRVAEYLLVVDVAVTALEEAEVAADLQRLTVSTIRQPWKTKGRLDR